MEALTTISLYDPEAHRRENVVNGFLSDRKYQVCTRCISDTTVPGITFDADGVCNFCHLHDKMEKQFPQGRQGEVILRHFFDQLKRRHKDRPYDCVVGLSGGRDSCYLLYCAVKLWGLRPLAVHFNDGFDNPVAGENMINLVKHLGVDLKTVTSHWKLAKDFKIAELKASNPLLNSGTDVGIGGALYSMAAQYGVDTVLFGQSFRTEGIKPISWAYIDGSYLFDIHKAFGRVAFDPKDPAHACFRLRQEDLIAYTLKNRIRVFAPLYHHNYVRKEAEAIMGEAFNWVYPGAHYYDDLYWSLITYIHRTKFNVDFRLNSYSALIRCRQMERNQALEAVNDTYVIEDPEVLELCVERLGLTWQEFEAFMLRPPTRFYELSSSYQRLKRYKWPLKLFCQLGFFPWTVYDKYFNCGA